MADNVNITEGSGKVIAADDIGSVFYQRVKSTWGPDGTANDTDIASGKALPVQLRGSDGTDRSNLLPVSGNFATITTQVTRPGDTTAYAAEDAFANSTSAPTSGGFTLTGCARASGGSGVITDAVVGMSTNAGTSLQGEVWLFDTSVTAINDNAAFSISDADRDKLVGIIPFTTNQSGSLNASAHVTGLNMGFTCVGSADLRFLVKVKNAYTPANAEVFTVRLKIQQVT